MKIDGDDDGGPASWRPIWLERERATARLIRRCFTLFMDGPKSSTEKLHALCKLTWITKGNGEVADNTRSVVIPALAALLNEELTAKDQAALVKELLEANAPTEIVEAAGHDVGFVNFYSAFRNTSETWIAENHEAVWNVFSTAATAGSDADARRAYAIVERLPPIPRSSGPLPAFNLLTPVLACLDRRGRSPIINSREAVKHRLRRLKLADGTLVEQFDGMIGLINQAGLEDAFALDTAADEALEEALQASRGRPAGVVIRRAAPATTLGLRGDEDIEFLRAEEVERHRLLHNKMTNALRTICATLGLHVEEGRELSNMFDAFIRSYLGTERHLLIEVKTSHAPAFCRLAVGQLLDYRRQLDGRASTDVAVLFPGFPDQHAREFLGYVGVKVLWLSPDMTKIEGDVVLQGGK